MITVVGIGADGWPSLGHEARAAVLTADLLVGGERQLALLPVDARAPRRPWPDRLTTLVDELRDLEAGRMTRLAIARAEQFGGLTGSRSDTPVTQWEFRA